MESLHLSGVLSSNTQVISVLSALRPSLAPNTSFFLSVSTTEASELQLIRWAVGDASDSGYIRAYMRLDRSWDTFAFTTFPRTAFRIVVIPEPSVAFLVASSVLLLAIRECRSTRQ